MVPRENEKFEEFLGELYDRGVNVHRRAKRILAHESLEPTVFHCDLLRLFPRGGQVHLVTTNFDLLFEKAVACVGLNSPEIYRAPALPLAREFEGIIHVHGSVAFPSQMVLTAKDFGHAYLTDGWALRFLVDLFNNFTILFVGYSHDDTIMNYLARAIMGGPSDRRYALTGSKENKDPNFWASRGIQPIIYTQATTEDYNDLYKAVHALAEFVQRPLAAWKKEIRDIAQAAPPVDQKKLDLIDYALGDKIKTRYFTEYTTDAEWINWLDSRKHLESLFGDGTLNAQARLLSSWLARRFAFKPRNKLFSLIENHGASLHPTFWDHLAEEIVKDTEPSRDTTALSRWISLLLPTTPEEGFTQDGWYVDTSDRLGAIGRRSIQLEMLIESLMVFDEMIQCRLLIEGSYFLPGDAKEENRQFSVNVRLVGKHKELSELWEHALKPNLSKIAAPLLECAIRGLEAQFRGFCAWERADRQLEPASGMRPAIEAHDQNIPGEESGVLIDAARDCLEWFVTHQPDVAAHWCNRLAKAESPLQRRLAIHTLSMREDLTPDDKIKWLLDKRFLHEYAIHHEVFRVVRQVYSRIDSNQRKALIQAVLAYRWKNKKHPETEEVNAKQHFRWLHWLHRSDENCPLAKRALDDLKALYPRLPPSDHPDFTSRIQHGYPDLPKPKTAQELLDMPISDGLSYLLSVDAPHLQDIEQDVKANVLAEATRQNVNWSIKLAAKLCCAENWGVYVWSRLILAWSSMQLDETQQKQAFQWFMKKGLYEKHGYEVADLLAKTFRPGVPSYVLYLLPQAKKIASALWRDLKQTPPMEESNNWSTTSKNSIAGCLADFWVSSLWHWREQQNPKPNNLSDEFRNVLSEIVMDQSPSGRLGRTVLASNFDLLLEADEVWTRNHLLPLFDPCSDDFQMAWDGFAREGKLNPMVAKAMEDSFLKAASHINTNLVNQRPDFVECYTIMLISFADNPIDEWIPKLLDESRQEVPKSDHATAHFSTDVNTTTDLFTMALETNLRTMSETERDRLWHRWLREYWQNRVEGVPVPLTPSEAKHMLDWLPALLEVFPDAVKFAIQMPKTPLRDIRFWFVLNTCDLCEKFPEAVAKLLRYLWSCDSEVMMRETDTELIDSLLQSDIPPALKLELDDIKAQL